MRLQSIYHHFFLPLVLKGLPKPTIKPIERGCEVIRSTTAHYVTSDLG